MPTINITKKLQKKQAVSHIARYKYLKKNKLIDWNVKGKRTDKGLSSYQKRKIRESYKVVKSIGPATTVYKPKKEKDESPLSYKRRINRMQRDAGIQVTPLSGVVVNSEMAKNMEVQDGKLVLENKEHDYKAEFHGFDINSLNSDEWEDYLWLFIKSLDISDNNVVSLINERNVGQGVGGYFLDDFIDELITTIKEYKSRGIQPTHITGILVERQINI